MPAVRFPDNVVVSSRTWLTKTFPCREPLIADLRQRISTCRAPVAAYPPAPDLFGLVYEHAVNLHLAERPPFRDVLEELPPDFARSLLGSTGFTPPPQGEGGYDDWLPGSTTPQRLVGVASLLAHVNGLLRSRTGDHRRSILRSILRHPEDIRICLRNTTALRPAFREFWTAYLRDFDDVLHGLGLVVPAPELLGGRRRGDLICGSALVEIKTGVLASNRELDDLLDQLLTYVLLGPPSGYPITEVRALLARYRVMVSYPADEFLSVLAGHAVDRSGLAADFARLVEYEAR